MRPMNHRNPWLPTVFNDLFDVNLMPRVNAQAPAINVLESEKSYTVEFAAPGMKKEDFSVNINGEGNLIVKMERKDEQNEENKNTHYLRREFSYAKYEQTLILPDDVEKHKISAKMENGVLYIELPKTEPAAQKVERQIEIG
ncbi:MAG: Hsp20/alpha crystallin family protein [Prevotella sp.]|nr:Hsp20/alpha crystallin family protein [Prevotella sp.]MBR6716602.1 Hsp20/alpha crystallin family protein [Prevotella sp.]